MCSRCTTVRRELTSEPSTSGMQKGSALRSDLGSKTALSLAASRLRSLAVVVMADCEGFSGLEVCKHCTLTLSTATALAEKLSCRLVHILEHAQGTNSWHKCVITQLRVSNTVINRDFSTAGGELALLHQFCSTTLCHRPLWTRKRLNKDEYNAKHNI